MSYEIRIDHGPETGKCWCLDGACGWHEEAADHCAVLDMRYHAVQHSIAEGHSVSEHVFTSDLVSPRTGTCY